MCVLHLTAGTQPIHLVRPLDQMAQVFATLGRSVVSNECGSEEGTETGSTHHTTSSESGTGTEVGSWQEGTGEVPSSVVVTGADAYQEGTEEIHSADVVASSGNVQELTIGDNTEDNTVTETKCECTCEALLGELEELKNRVNQYDEGIEYVDDKVDKLEEATLDAMDKIEEMVKDCFEEAVMPMRHELNDAHKNTGDLVEILMEVRTSVGELEVEQNRNEKTSRNVEMLEEAHSATDEMVGRIAKDIGVLFDDQKKLRKSMKRVNEKVYDWSGYRSNVRAAFMEVKAEACVLKSHLTEQQPAVAALLERFELALGELWDTIEDDRSKVNDDADDETNKKRKRSDP